MPKTSKGHISLPKTKGGLCLAIVSALLCLSQSAAPSHAQGLKLSDGSPSQFSSLATGEQLVLENYGGPIEFAGKEVTLSDFSGIIGYASDLGYIVVIDGIAKTEGRDAARGRIMMFPPFGEQVSVASFDAGRLLDVWNEEILNDAAGTYASLNKLAKHQSRGIFFGRLGRTSFNVAASGLASHELANRTIVGDKIVRDIRFQQQSDDQSIPSKVVDLFVRALVEHDAHSLAQLMDPLPFGNSDLRSGASEARLAMAEALLEERNWKAELGSNPSFLDLGNNRWRLSGQSRRTIIALRPTKDFIFIKSISAEE